MYDIVGLVSLGSQNLVLHSYTPIYYEGRVWRQAILTLVQVSPDLWCNISKALTHDSKHGLY